MVETVYDRQPSVVKGGSDNVVSQCDGFPSPAAETLGIFEQDDEDSLEKVLRF